MNGDVSKNMRKGCLHAPSVGLCATVPITVGLSDSESNKSDFGASVDAAFVCFSEERQEFRSDAQ